jgi:hypothetical protein
MNNRSVTVAGSGVFALTPANEVTLPAPWGNPSHPLVYVSYGSVTARQPQFAPMYQATLDVLSDLPVRVLMTTGRGLDPSVLNPDHHQPCLRAQRNKISEMASMINNRMIKGIHRVDSLTITFMPKTEDSDVMGRVRTAMTASLSAAMVIFVSVRAR